MKDLAKSSSDQSGDDYKDPFFEPPPPVLGKKSSSDSHRTLNVEDYLDSDLLVHVEICSTYTDASSSFFLPVSLLATREKEMRFVAQEFGIESDRWAESLIFRRWREALDEKSHNIVQETKLVFHPERDCAASNYSHSFVWRKWLTSSLRAFFNTGTIRIPTECAGNDVLLALEYFGILYAPHQLAFDSFAVYLRVKRWSDYYTQRGLIANWIVQQLLKDKQARRNSQTFVTSPDRTENDILVGSRKAKVLDGGIHPDFSKYDDTPSCAIVHDFFNDDNDDFDNCSASKAIERYDELMRDDFRDFLQSSLPGSSITFDVDVVKVLTDQKSKLKRRAVMHIDFLTNSSSSSEDSKSPQTLASSLSNPSKQSNPRVPSDTGTKMSAATVQRDNRAGTLQRGLNHGQRTSESEACQETPPSPKKKHATCRLLSADHVYEDLAKKLPASGLLSVDHIYEELEKTSGSSSKVVVKKPTRKGDDLRHQKSTLFTSTSAFEKVVNSNSPVTHIEVKNDGLSVASGLTGSVYPTETIADSAASVQTRFRLEPSRPCLKQRNSSDYKDFSTPVDALSVSDTQFTKPENHRPRTGMPTTNSDQGKTDFLACGAFYALFDMFPDLRIASPAGDASWNSPAHQSRVSEDASNNMEESWYQNHRPLPTRMSAKVRERIQPCKVELRGQRLQEHPTSDSDRSSLEESSGEQTPPSTGYLQLELGIPQQTKSLAVTPVFPDKQDEPSTVPFDEKSSFQAHPSNASTITQDVPFDEKSSLQVVEDRSMKHGSNSGSRGGSKQARSVQKLRNKVKKQAQQGKSSQNKRSTTREVSSSVKGVFAMDPISESTPAKPGTPVAQVDVDDKSLFTGLSTLFHGVEDDYTIETKTSQENQQPQQKTWYSPHAMVRGYQSSFSDGTWLSSWDTKRPTTEDQEREPPVFCHSMCDDWTDSGSVTGTDATMSLADEQSLQTKREQAPSGRDPSDTGNGPPSTKATITSTGGTVPGESGKRRQYTHSAEYEEYLKWQRLKQIRDEYRQSQKAEWDRTPAASDDEESSEDERRRASEMDNNIERVPSPTENENLSSLFLKTHRRHVQEREMRIDESVKDNKGTSVEGTTKKTVRFKKKFLSLRRKKGRY